MPIKVLFATPYKVDTGGITQWAGHIVDHYEANGRGDCVLDVLPMNDPKNQSTMGAPLPRRIIRGCQTYGRVLSNLKRVIKSNHYDILHISTSASISLIKDYLMLRLAKRYGVDTIVHFHFGRIPILLEKKNWEYRLLIKVIKQATRVIVMDKASYDALLGLGINNAHLVPNPLSAQVEKYIEQNSDVERQRDTILFVGHVVKNKGIFELVEACKDIPNCKLKVVGPVQPNVRLQLRDMAGDTERLELVGSIPLEQVIREMLSCSIFVLPTYTEGFPNVIIESMACGCPIITTPVGAIPEMLLFDTDAPCGVCVPPKNVEELRFAIQKLLAKPLDAQKMGASAKNRVSLEYSMNIVWTKLVDIWKSI